MLEISPQNVCWFLSGLSTNVMELLRRRIRQWRNGLESEFSNPKLLFEKTCDSVSKWSTICGWERFEPNYTRANPRFIFLMVDIFFFFVVSILCLKDLWGQRVEFIFCLVTLGLGFQVSYDLIFMFFFTNFILVSVFRDSSKRTCLPTTPSMLYSSTI